MSSSNSILNRAKDNKNDEFYTQYKDVENELNNYAKYFEDKVIYCNCDNPKYSNFWKYFRNNFYKFRLKGLISTYYSTNEVVYKTHMFLNENGDLETKVTKLEWNGDFRSQECLETLEQADMVVTNPPFSLIRELFATLRDFKKDFIILGTQNVATYKEQLKAINLGEMHFGYFYGQMYFNVPGSNKLRRIGNIGWFTNLPVERDMKDLPLTRSYYEDPSYYKKYDHYDAINVDTMEEIPYDYDGVMGVPVTIMSRFNDKQFELLGDTRYHDGCEYADDIGFIDGKEIYRRMLVKLRNPVKDKP